MALVLYSETAPLGLFRKSVRELDVNGQKFIIQQDWNGAGVAAVVWDAAFVLSMFLSKFLAAELRGKRVIELGAGTGLAGMTAVKLGAFTTFTEKQEFLNVTRENVDRNLEFNGEYSIRTLEWGKNLDKWEEEKGKWDYVIGADIIYLEDTFPDLLRTLEFLVDGKNTEVLLACKIRYQRDKNFFVLMQQKFHVELIHYDEKTDIKIYKGVKKQQGSKGEL